MFMDMQVMVFIGFGFTMAFLRTHSWTAISFNFIMAMWAIELAVLWIGLADSGFKVVEVGVVPLMKADYCAVACLITMGAVLGKVSFVQLFVLVTLETLFYTVNRYVIMNQMKVHDYGHCLTTHLFGAYFGLAASYWFNPKKALEMKGSDQQNTGNYNSQLIAMLGTVILFVYWPSFNASMTNYLQERVVINTYLSLMGSALMAVFVSRVFKGKIDMEVLLHATLSGGVVISGFAEFLKYPGGAILAGGVTGAISALSYLVVNKRIIQQKLKLHDTCGVGMSHGFPAILGIIISAVISANGDENLSEIEVVKYND